MLNPTKIVSLIGSIDEQQKNLDDENIILYGEYSAFLKKINEYLLKAIKYASKDTEKEIINEYLQFFKTGEIYNHKEAQKKWVKENSTIEFNIGWNEKILDPIGVRGLFEGFVGIVDNFHSQNLFYNQMSYIWNSKIK